MVDKKKRKTSLTVHLRGMRVSAEMGHEIEAERARFQDAAEGRIVTTAEAVRALIRRGLEAGR